MHVTWAQRKCMVGPRLYQKITLRKNVRSILEDFMSGQHIYVNRASG